MVVVTAMEGAPCQLDQQREGLAIVELSHVNSFCPMMRPYFNVYTVLQFYV